MSKAVLGSGETMLQSRQIDTANSAKSLDEETSGELPVQEDDWGLSMEFHLFAQHEEHAIALPNDQVLKLLCVESLTPLDMMHLGSGIHDATGHCAWTASFLLLHTIESIQHTYKCFTGKRMLELGCGTGIGGLSVAITTGTAHASLTDNDPQVLELCRRNCRLNAPNIDGNVSVEALTWGKEQVQQEYFDTVLATDVLYDISMLMPLLHTAHKALAASDPEGGFFVLSHVPRACYNSENPPVEDLDQFIILKASDLGFSLKRVIRPSEVSNQTPSDAPRKLSELLSDALSMQEMEDIGASVFVFQKNRK